MTNEKRTKQTSMNDITNKSKWVNDRMNGSLNEWTNQLTKEWKDE